MLASNTARRVSQDAKNQMTGPKVSISGQIAKVFYTGDRSGKSLLLIKARDGAVFKVEGPLPVPPLMGMRIQTEAYAVEHPKYGTQYKADLITEEVPIDRPGAVAFMAKTLAGVGKVLASKLFDAFGERVYETIQNHPQELLKVPGMTQEKLGPLLESWKEHANTRMLWTYLAKYEIGGGTAAKIYAKFGAQAATVAMHRPYQLTAVDGVGFATVDRIALSSGVRADSVGRVIAALRFALDANKKRGSTSCPRDALINQATRLLAVESEGSVSGPAPSREAISKAIDECVEREALKIVQVRGVACVVTPAMQQLESLLADHVLRIAKPVAPENAEPDKPVLDPAILVARAHAAAEHLGDAAQIEAVALPFKHAFTVITGGPGCGKTTVTKQITKVAEEAGLRVVMMAPTGKAARRMAEVTGKPVDTIHSTLQPESGEFNSFKRNEHNPLEGDLFIADESTMADAYVALALLRAIPTGAKVLFVGDVDQLPSVGPGAVMRDLIQSETVPVARLSTPHRTALNSDIVVNAHRIISGNAESVQTDGRRDFTVLNLADEEAHQAILVRYQEMANAYGKDGVQVLAPTYDGPVGVTALNAALQARVNPPSMERPEIEHHGVVFRLGDRVMQTSNNKQLNVVNGEVGFVSAVDMESKALTVNFGTKEVVLKDKALLSVDLAYAITIHKSQGSEYPGVITVCSASASFMLDRNLVYTAVTRAKKHSEIIGDVDTLKMAIRKLGGNRCTTFTNALRERFELPPLQPIVRVSKPVNPLVEARRQAAAIRTQSGTNSAQRGSVPVSKPAASTAPVGRLSMLKPPVEPEGTSSTPAGAAEPTQGAQAPISQSTRVSASVAAPGLAAAATGARTRLFGGLGLQMPDDSGGMWGDSEPSDQILNCERTFDSMPKAAAPTRSFQPN